jgi:transposase-like protein
VATAEHPVAGVDYPGTYQQLLEWFPNDAACIAYLEKLRWPDGFSCPACGGDSYWRTQRGLLMCRDCGRKTSVTAGTIFHRTRTPLSTWFAAMWFITSQKNGISAQGLQRVLGFGSYETAWAWMHKLRRVMVRPDRERLAGEVELDEIFVGGRATGRLGASTSKVPIMVAVERGERGRLGRVRMEVADRPNTSAILEFARSTIAEGSTIHTDGTKLFRKLPALGFHHEYIAGYKAEDLDTVMPGVHLVSSLVKRWLTGTLHYAASRQHLDYYLDEFTFRFNRRTSAKRGLLFYRLLQQAVDVDPHPLKDLVGGG